MKKAIIYILIIIPTLVGSQPVAFFNELEFDYKGEIESVMIEAFKPIMKSGEIVDFKYDSGLFGYGTQELFFDEIGKIIKKLEYETKCGGDSIQISKIWKYYYTDTKLDSVIRQEIDSIKLEKGFPTWKFKYNYESDSIYYQTSNLTFTKKCRVTETTNQIIRDYLTNNSQIRTTEITTFDSLKRKIKFESIKKGVLSIISISHYNSEKDKNANQINTIDLIKNTVKRRTNKLNEFGDILKTILYKPNGEYMTHWSFKYEYDAIGNWTQKEKYNYEDRMLTMFKQTIKYNKR